MKLIAGLGNPGARYDDTRHNVGWWAVDRIAHDWSLGAFRSQARGLVAAGTVDGAEVLLVKPTDYMNRSGPSLLRWLKTEGFDPAADLLVIVDDAALDVGRIRFRPRGSPGGHNGLASVSAVLGSHDWARLRIGVGRPPAERDLVEWVLSPLEPDDEDRVVALLPDLSEAAALWIREGIEPVMSRYNR